MKVEYGVALDGSGDLLLADLIDNDSWRLWVAGDKQQMVDKQIYRNLAADSITSEAMRKVAVKYEWVARHADLLVDAGARVEADVSKATETRPMKGCVRGRVVVMLGSATDRPIYEQIAAVLCRLGVPTQCRVASAHKSTEYTLRLLAQYDGDGVPTVYVAVAGRSNGLGPVMAGNTCSPVINCPPTSGNVWDTQDVWSSLRLPSGLGCTTVLSPDAAAMAAAQTLAQQDHVLWGTLRVGLLDRALAIIRSDAEMVQADEAKQAKAKA